MGRHPDGPRQQRPRHRMMYIISSGVSKTRRRLRPTGWIERGPTMQQPLKHDVTAAANQSGLLAPAPSGMNFYRADPALTDLLRIHLPDVLFHHVESHLDRLGGLAGGHL